MQAKSSSNILGIDVSHYQGTVDWSSVKNSGVQFVYVKASQGTTSTDPMFATNVNGARAVGLSVGAYHFANPVYTDPNAEAQHFFYTIKNVMPDFGDLAPVLDLELPTDPSQANGSDLANWAKTFINEFTYLSGRGVMIYTGNWYIDQFSLTGLGQFQLWVANYGTNQPPNSGDWTYWTAFQYSESGTVDGISGSVDMDVAMSLDELYGFKVCNPSITRKTLTDLNIRWGPSTNYGVVQTIPAGTNINITKLNPSWAYTTYGSTGGWVARRYLGMPQ